MNKEDKERLLIILVSLLGRPSLDGAPFLDIEKVFYHLRDRLGEDNEIRELLPYYWYIDGYMSDTVSEAVTYGTEIGVLDTRPTTATGTGIWYSLDEPSSLDLEDTNGDLEEAEGAIDDVLEEDYNLFDDYESKIKQIYSDTPYEFQQYFKTEVLLGIESWKRGGLMNPTKDELSSKIVVAESYLPIEGEFLEFNEVFDSYVNISTRYLRNVKEDDKLLVDTFETVSNDVWELFCHKLRIAAHDDYYDNKVDEWDSIFRENKRIVEGELVLFRNMVDKVFSEPDAEDGRVAESNTWANVAASYIEDAEFPIEE